MGFRLERPIIHNTNITRGNAGEAAKVTQTSTSDHLPRVSLVIPTKNEAKNLEILLPQLPAWLHEIVIVDGLSTDNTLEVARRLCPTAKIVLETTRGKGAAMRAGFAACTGEVIVSFDADCSAHFDELHRLITPLTHGYDFAKGSRYLTGGRSDDFSLVRRWGNWCLTQITNLLYGAHFTDLCYGFFAFRRELLGVFDLHGVDGFEIETALQVQALNASARIVEVASIEKQRVFGHSNLHAFRDGLRILRTIIGGLWQPHRTIRPEQEPHASGGRTVGRAAAKE